MGLFDFFKREKGENSFSQSGRKPIQYPTTAAGACCCCGKSNYSKTYYKIPVDKALCNSRVWESVVGNNVPNNSVNRDKMKAGLAAKGMFGMTVCEDCVNSF